MNNHITHILSGCAHNERRSQKELFELFRKNVFSICYRYEGRSHMIKELVNESFVRVFKNIKPFLDNQFTDTYVRTSLQTWIQQMAVTTCVEYYQKGMMNDKVHFANTESNAQIKSDKTVMQTISHNQMIEAIRQLPSADRMIYNLFAVEKMSLENIADLLRISVIESQLTLERARERIKKSLSIVNFTYKNNADDSPYTMISEADSKAS